MSALGDGTPEKAYNQGVRLFLFTRGNVGLLAIVMRALIVDQEVVGSSPTSRPFFPSKGIARSFFKWSGFVVSTRSPIQRNC